MLDIRWIRDNPDLLDRALETRGAALEAARLVDFDETRRAAIGKLEEAQKRRNAASKAIGKAKGQGDEAAAQKLMTEVADLKSVMQALEGEVRTAEQALDGALATVPNIPLDDVPVGPDESANVEYRRWGEQPARWRDDFEPKEHFDIGVGLGGMDFETAAKLSGSRFVVLKDQVARMERALGQFMLDLHTQEHGYTEVQPPLLVRDDALFGTAQLPKFSEDQFSAFRLAEASEKILLAINQMQRELPPEQRANLGGEAFEARLRETMEQRIEVDYWLIPTAEVPLTNLVRQSILAEDDLPMRVTALTPCFRSEAGAAGRDTRGMLRQHQFDKVELVSITTPEQSSEEHERMLVCAEEVMKRLDLHYRVMTLSTGDMGFAARKTWDIEVWLPGQGTYREISSCSLCGDFQARRMNARYRPSEAKANRFVHTLNGSGVAVGRALIAVLENYQNEDGSVSVPEVLQPYMGGCQRLEPER
jgi:seryl-tRNA synthetase